MSNPDEDSPMGPSLPPSPEQCRYGHLDWEETRDDRRRVIHRRCGGMLPTGPCPEAYDIPYDSPPPR